MILRWLAIFLAAVNLFSGVVFAATISLDAVTRSVTTSALGGTQDLDSSSGTGIFNERAETLNGADGGEAIAMQNTVLVDGGALSLYTQTDLYASGSRGGSLAPVSLSSESLVEIQFTVPQQVGSAAYWITGSYTVLGGADDGTPRVSWSLTSTGNGPPTPVFAGTANSGSGMPISETGMLTPGTYELQFQAQVGAPAGPTSFVASNGSGMAAIQDLSVAVSPIAVVPEPSTTLLLVLGGWSLLYRRQRRAAS